MKLNSPEELPKMRRDGQTTRDAIAVLNGTSKKSGLGHLLPFLGPAFIASVAYVDPGNFATNIAGGAQFGYTLLWVIVASNLMTMLIQSLSAKLGIASDDAARYLFIFSADPGTHRSIGGWSDKYTAAACPGQKMNK